MRGRAQGRAVLALIGTATLAVAIGSTALGAPAPKEGCAWHRHAKRVVRHVRRHGKPRKVARVRHWWTCDPTPAAPTPVPPAAGAPEEPTAPLISHLGVKAVEWSYTLSRPEVPAGELIVELNNQGEDNHNLKLVREDGGEPALVVPEAAPTGHTSGRFTLAPGTYRLYCSLFQHDEKGMHATLLVTGP